MSILLVFIMLVLLVAPAVPPAEAVVDWDVYDAEFQGIAPLSSHPFTDARGHWAEPSIAYVYTRRIMSGTSPTLFSPDSRLTREQFVAILGRIANIDRNHWWRTIPSGFPFSGDVPNNITVPNTSRWYIPYIRWAWASGILTNFPAFVNRFGVGTQLTREEFAFLLNSYCEVMAVPIDLLRPGRTFRDHQTIGLWARPAVVRMYRARVIYGMNINGHIYFQPHNRVTRAEAATMLHRLHVNHTRPESTRRVDVSVGFSNSFHEHWVFPVAEANLLIRDARLPFYNRWNINLHRVSTERITSSTLFPENGCPRSVDLQCTTATCGSHCRTQHHKNWDRNMDALRSNWRPAGRLRVALTSDNALCDSRTGGHRRSPFLGLGDPGGTLSMNLANRAQPIRNVRIIQHEISHNYGLIYQPPCPPGTLCIMSSGFLNEPNMNLVNIWCPACQRMMQLNRLRH